MSQGTMPGSSPQVVHQPIQRPPQMNPGQAALLAQQRAQLAQNQNQNQNQNQFQQQQSITGVKPQPQLGQNGSMPNMLQFPAGGDSSIYTTISDAELISTGRTMIPKLNTQMRAQESVSQKLPTASSSIDSLLQQQQMSEYEPDHPARGQSEASLAKIHGFRNGLLKEMVRRGLDPQSLGLSAGYVACKTLSSQHSAISVNFPSVSKGGSTGQSPMSQQQQQQNGALRFQQNGSMQQNMSQAQGSPANRATPLVNKALAQPQSNSMSTQSVLNGLIANSGSIPRATAPIGLALQSSRAIPPQNFYHSLQALASKKGLDTSTKEVDGQPVDPYTLFLVVCRFGGQAEVRNPF
jgi:hypothetical protein